MEKFGQRLNKLRKIKGLSIEKTSELTGISSGAISEIENGANPKLETIEKIASGLNLSSEEKHHLVFGEKIQKDEKQVSNYEILQKIDVLENKIEAISHVVNEERRGQPDTPKPASEVSSTSKAGVSKGLRLGQKAKSQPP